MMHVGQAVCIIRGIILDKQAGKKKMEELLVPLFVQSQCH